MVALPLGLLVSFPLYSGSKEKISTSRPNVIMVVLDDMKNFEVRETEKIKTPNIDKLRSQSVTFSLANCSAPLCMPSRASFFTGIYPHRSGAYTNGGDPWNGSEVLKQAETLPELFKRSGYYTFGRGKIYHALMEKGRLERNFDNRPIFEGGFGPFPDKEHRVFSEKDNFVNFWGVQAFPDSLFPDVINTSAAIDFLKQKHNSPFFMALGLYRPHSPFTAPQRFFDMYDVGKIETPKGYLANDLDDVPYFGKSLLDPFGRFKVTGANNVDQWKHFIHGYFACASFADWNIGRLLDAVKQSGCAENTIVIVLSDNGFHLGIKNHWEKNTMWDTSALVPLIIQIPALKSKGATVGSPVGLIDLYPTLVDLCHLKNPKQVLDGISLRPFLEKQGYNWDRPTLTSLGENLISIRSQKYRYIQYSDGTAELYDTEIDPFEWNNLINKTELSSVVKKLQKSIPSTFMKEVPGGRRN